jgi:hypothetical protein
MQGRNNWTQIMGQTQTVIVYRNPIEAAFYQNIGCISGGVFTFGILLWALMYLRDKAARRWNWSLWSKSYIRSGYAAMIVSAIAGLAMLLWLA